MKLRKIFSWIVVLASGALVETAYAYEYPDSVRDRPIILAAAQNRGISMDKLEFPLIKQVYTAPITALAKIPELIGYVAGENDRFVTLHIITFNSQGKRYTCGAYVASLSNNSWEVEISICGQDSTAFYKGDIFLRTTPVTIAQIDAVTRSNNLTEPRDPPVLKIGKPTFE